MLCDVCGGINGHRHGCPESGFELKASEYCDICNEGIYEDEEYIENENGDKAHYDCLYGYTTRELIEWFGYEIRRMR